MRTVRTKVYSFDELSEGAKEKVLNNFRDINTNYDDWSEPLLEGFKEYLHNSGFLDPEIYFSGFWSQGDGLCFDAKIETSKFAETTNEKRIVKLIDLDFLEGFEIQKTCFSNHYSHEKTRYIDFSPVDQKNINIVLELMSNKIETIRKNMCLEFYSKLEKYYYELQSYESVKESIIANEYEFTKDGNLFN